MNATDSLSSDARTLAAGLAARGWPRRIVLVTGPGDVVGTYTHWRAGRDDPSIPNIGYSHQIYDAAAALDVPLLTIAEQASETDPSDERFSFDAVAPPSGRGFRHHLREIAYLLGLVQRAWREGADILMLQRMSLHFYALAPALLLGMTLVLSLHNTFWAMGKAPSAKLRPLFWLSGRLMRCRRVIVLAASPEIERQVTAVSGRRPRQMALHLPQYAADRLPARSDEAQTGPAMIVFVGRVTVEKGVFLLLEAFETVRKRHPEARLVYAGDGAALESLRDAVARSPCQNAVELLGQVDGDAVFTLLSQATLLACPTLAGFPEGLAQTPLEAALAGVPSVVSDVVPVAEIMGDAVAVHPEGDANALAETIDTILADPARHAAMRTAGLEIRATLTDRSLSSSSRLLSLLSQEAAR
ncbi:MAG: glycosyltransferase family 4 protein [Pseudomonadota bacterium]